MSNKLTSTGIGIFLLILLIVRFFRPVLLEPFNNYFNGLKYCVILTAIPFIMTKGKLFSQDIILRPFFNWYFIFAILNILTCFYFRGQSPFISYWAWIPFFFMLYYPAFLSVSLKLEDWENILFSLYQLFLVCFILQFLLRGSVQLFRLDTEFEYLERESRVRIFSDSILYFGTLYCLNKYLVKESTKMLIYFLIGTACIFLQGFRMLILGYTVISFVMFIRLYKLSFKTTFFIGVVLAFSLYGLQTRVVQDKLTEIVDRNETANFENESYVRVLLVDYYYNNHFINKLEMFLGSGMPHMSPHNPERAESEYSRQCSYNAFYYHFYPVDMGLLGLSWNAGIPFTITFILLMLLVARMKVPRDYWYVAAWEIFIVIVGLTNEISYYHSNIIYQVVALVIITKVHEEQQLDFNYNLNNEKFLI